MAVAYDPSARYEIKVWDAEYRKDPARPLMARVYQPQGAGPFPALLDLHGGAWNDQDRTANAPMDERLVIKPGPQTDRAVEMIKAFIARQLRASHITG